MAWGVILILLCLGGLVHIALSHSSRYHHLGTNSWLHHWPTGDHAEREARHTEGVVGSARVGSEALLLIPCVLPF